MGLFLVSVLSLALLVFYSLASEDFMRFVIGNATNESSTTFSSEVEEQLEEKGLMAMWMLIHLHDHTVLPPTPFQCFVASPELSHKPERRRQFPIGVAVVWWGVVISYGTLFGMVTALYYCYRQRGKKESALDIRTELRIQQEKEEQDRAFEVILPNPIKPDELGSRLQKYWSIQQQGIKKMVVTVAPLPRNCFLDLKHNQCALNKFLATLKHPNVQPITCIQYVEETNQVAIFQPFWDCHGSLRDLLYRENPADDWSKKYTGTGTGLSLEKVRTYGRQILEGVIFLYGYSFNEIELRPLGHIHTGNIYLDNAGNCLVGGYENSLLQYRTRLYKEILQSKCLPDIDTILFGHVIYEMAMGEVISGVFPDFGGIPKEYREILEYIFARKRNGRLAHSIKQIMSKDFFATPSERAKVSVIRSFSTQAKTKQLFISAPIVTQSGGSAFTKKVKLAEAEGRARMAEDRATRAEERVAMAEERAAMAVGRAEGRARDAESRTMRAECKVTEAEGRAAEAEGRTREAEGMAAEAEGRAREADARVVVVESRAREAEGRAAEAEGRAREAYARVSEVEGRAREAEGRAAEAEGRAREADARVVEVEGRAREAEGRAAEAEGRARQLELQWVVEGREIQLTEEELGRGAWATVSVAVFRGTRVAAKCIHHQLISQYTIQLFRREMDMAARIRHSNMLQFIGATQEGQMVILTELMPTSLRREMQQDSFSPETASSIALDVARALNYLHLMLPDPLVHRDISSANVLLEPLPHSRWRAKVSDYGTVNLQEQLQTENPGNVCYAAPEASDPTQQSPKMDIYSFGVLLMEMLTRQFPSKNNRSAHLHSICQQPLFPLIQRCQQRRKEDRPTASDIIAQLYP